MAKDKAANKGEETLILGKMAEILVKMDRFTKILEQIEKRLSGGFA